MLTRLIATASPPIEGFDTSLLIDRLIHLAKLHLELRDLRPAIRCLEEADRLSRWNSVSCASHTRLRPVG